MTKEQDEPGDTVTADETEDQPKRREILDGARQVFRASGFDGASMGQIAQAAGVSKGTLYVYFESKEALFQALVTRDRNEAAEQLFQCGDKGSDIATLLQRVGESFVTMMARPDHIALVRMVIGAAEKFPESGRTFFETGPSRGVARLSTLLRPHVEAGDLAIDDIEFAASTFFCLCQGNLIKPLLFGCGKQPSADDIRRTVAAGVAVFLRAYAPAGKA